MSEGPTDPPPSESDQTNHWWFRLKVKVSGFVGIDIMIGRETFKETPYRVKQRKTIMTIKKKKVEKTKK